MFLTVWQWIFLIVLVLLICIRFLEPLVGNFVFVFRSNKGKHLMESAPESDVPENVDLSPTSMVWMATRLTSGLGRSSV